MLKKFFKSEGGFTLVELLVTIAILAVLFGITTLTLSGVGANAEQTVCDAEVAVVQSAIDIYLAADADVVTANATAAKITSLTGEFAKYLRNDTKGSYVWGADGSGLVQTLCPAP